MRKLLFVFPASALLLVATGCESDEFNNAEECVVSFEVVSPAVPQASRAFGDGSMKKTLQYAIYDEGSTTPRFEETDGVEEVDGKFLFSLRLPKNRSYEVVMWAETESGSSFYTFDPSTRSVTINYDGALSNDESRDAFCAAKTIEITSGASVQRIELKRPFAQLNVGTLDLADVVGDVSAASVSSQVEFTDIPNCLNLWDGSRSGKANVVFAKNDSPLSEEFPMEGGYAYLAMAYVLPPTGMDDGLSDVTYTIYNGADELASTTATGVSLQANYRSNIVGNLLTDMTNFEVVVVPAFGTSAGSGNGQSGQNAPQSRQAQDGTTIYTVMSGDELQWIQTQSVNDPSFWDRNSFELGADIDLSGMSRAVDKTVWTPIDVNASRLVEINGNGHTVSGYTFADDAKGGKGLFGTVANGYIHDITVADVDFVGSNGSNVGALVGSIHGTLENVTAKNIAISVAGGSNVGAVAGVVSGTTEQLEDFMLATTSVEKSSIHGSASVGAIAGKFDNTSVARDANAFFVLEHPLVTGTTVTSSDNRCGLLAGSSSNVDETIFYSNLEESGNNTSTLLGAGKIDATAILGSATAQFANGVYAVYNSMQLIDAFNRATEGQTVSLMADIDYHGLEISPIDFVSTTTPVVFNGNGHVIRNFVLNDGSLAVGKTDLAFFTNNSTTVCMEIRNLTFENCEVKSDKKAAIVATRFEGILEKVNIVDCRLNTSASGCGILFGIAKAVDLKNCSMTGCVLTGAANNYGLIAGQFGYGSNGTFNMTNCQLNGNRINSTTANKGVLCGTIVTGKQTINLVSFVSENNTDANGVALPKIPSSVATTSYKLNEE